MSERLLERAELNIELETQVALTRMRAAMSAEGRTHCEDCGREIEAARRAAAPFAVRCLECQQSTERGYR